MLEKSLFLVPMCSTYNYAIALSYNASLALTLVVVVVFLYADACLLELGKEQGKHNIFNEIFTCAFEYYL